MPQLIRIKLQFQFNGVLIHNEIQFKKELSIFFNTIKESLCYPVYD